MVWRESYKLSWSDFKGEPNYEVSASAITAYGISFRFSITEKDAHIMSFTTEVLCHFYPEKSWYKPDERSDTLLKHEQLHFDITELHARKLRYAIAELKVSKSLKKELKTLNNRVNKALTAMQKRYDDETNYSRNDESQIKWQTFVSEELEKLSQFKSKP